MQSGVPEPFDEIERYSQSDRMGLLNHILPFSFRVNVNRSNPAVFAALGPSQPTARRHCFFLLSATENLETPLFSSRSELHGAAQFGINSIMIIFIAHFRGVFFALSLSSSPFCNIEKQIVVCRAGSQGLPNLSRVCFLGPIERPPFFIQFYGLSLCKTPDR